MGAGGSVQVATAAEIEHESVFIPVACPTCNAMMAWPVHKGQARVEVARCTQCGALLRLPPKGEAESRKQKRQSSGNAGRVDTTGLDGWDFYYISLMLDTGGGGGGGEGGASAGGGGGGGGDGGTVLDQLDMTLHGPVCGWVVGMTVVCRLQETSSRMCAPCVQKSTGRPQQLVVWRLGHFRHAHVDAFAPLFLRRRHVGVGLRSVESA